ncbi:class I SAM-dependent methyltransferase [Saccharopolyspora gloriosae]|uniref:SAM-dependent methyltransferase n=1 Tax=Saccharopolyspora gloriosae TaxID=455344 RepID=A0A840NEI6_9PSEU|nr:class I SAM-dependent methyltransferase [Saccharopolyspora gloriosae]MBB5070340.1 SAM-dependent methyltransferase [Saccharopolyspora gloriosae]
MPDDERFAKTIDLGRTDFDAVYRGDGLAEVPFEKPPWDIGEPQPQVVRLERDGAFRGRVLDAGCGAGENAIFLAARGYAVTGVDGSPSAIEIARRRASDHGADVTFQVADATRMDGVPQEFDTVLDSALYHCLPEDARAAYSAALHQVTRPGAGLHLLCFADVERRTPFIPAAISQDELRANFGAHWRIAGIEEVDYSAAFDEETAVRTFGEHFASAPPGRITTDDEGRITIPMWHLRAERA